MEEKKTYTKPEMEVVEFMYSATLLEDVDEETIKECKKEFIDFLEEQLN